MTRASRVRRLAAAGAFGGGGVGLAAAGGWGLLVVQAKRARGTIGDPTELPPATDGMYGDGSGEPISLAVLGDSSAAGLGAGSAAFAPPALFAAGVARASGRPVRVTTVAYVGAMSRDLHAQIEAAVHAAPVAAVIMVGANDVTHKVRVPNAARELGIAVTTLREHGCEVVVATCPDLGTIEPIAFPLRWVARQWSRQLAAVQTMVVVEAGGRSVSLGDLLGPEFAARPTVMFSPDRFHPSAHGYTRAAEAILPSLLAVLGLGEPDEVRGEDVLPVAQAAVEAAAHAGTEVTAADVPGSDRGRLGRLAQLRHRRRPRLAPAAAPRLDDAMAADQLSATEG